MSQFFSAINRMSRLQHFRLILLPVVMLFLVLTCVPSARAAEVVVIGDLNYRQVAEVSAEIRNSLRVQVREVNLAEVRGKVGAFVERENPRVVVALGVDALAEAVRLPSTVAVVYGLVIVPPATTRANVSGVYMSVPVAEYLALARRILPAATRIAVIGSPQLATVLAADSQPQVSVHRVTTTAELLAAAEKVTGQQAILLLPDANLITAASLEKIYLHSFKSAVPVLGISESSVKQGSLVALVFDSKGMGRQLGEKVRSILQSADSSELKHAPPRKFNLFINDNTAEKMKITIPDDLSKRAKKVYK